MKEANEEQLRQKHERRMAEKEEHNRLVQIMNDKHRVRVPMRAPFEPIGDFSNIFLGRDWKLACFSCFRQV